jgi:hypothetical protein
MAPQLNYIVKQENKFNIGDGSIDIIELDKEGNAILNDPRNPKKKEIDKSERVLQIVTSFKTCEENTFTVFVAQFNYKRKEFKIIYRYTSYQLWESAVKGFLSAFKQDFIIMSKEGMSYIRLDKNKPRRAIKRKN